MARSPKTPESKSPAAKAKAAPAKAAPVKRGSRAAAEEAEKPVKAAASAKPAPKAAAKAKPVVKAAAPKAKPAAKSASPAKAAAKPAASAKPAPKATEKAKPAAKAAAIKAASAAGPDAAAAKPRRAKREKVTPDRLELLVAAAYKSLEDDKDEDLVVLDVTGRASFADRMIIATGQVERQLQAMAAHVQDALEKIGLKLRRDSIQGSPDWVLIDCGDLIVHLFKPEAREAYGLERMWGPGSPAAEG